MNFSVTPNSVKSLSDSEISSVLNQMLSVEKRTPEQEGIVVIIILEIEERS
jgi:hypothetical protein